jgi:hypothetical protein
MKPLLSYAEGVIGKRRGGHKVVGIQGPCVECFNDTWSGFFECLAEYNAQAGSGPLNLDARFLGTVKSQGSNHLILTSVFRRYRFDTSVLLEDWHWSIDMLEKENLSLAFARTMVSFGQTPVGWNSIARRRNRWNKGRIQESLFDALQRSCWGPNFMNWLEAWAALALMFFVRPLFHMLMLLGYGAVFNASSSHGRHGILDPNQLEATDTASGELGYLWNYSWIASLALVGSEYGIRLVRAISKLDSTCFLNGRNNAKYKYLHVVVHFVDAFVFLYGPFTRLYQYEYYCRVEYMLLEKFLCQKAEWIPTPKKAEETGACIDEEDDTSKLTSNESSIDLMALK